MLYPADSITKSIDIMGNNTEILLSTSTHFHVFYVAVNTQSNDQNATVSIYCGTNVLLENHNFKNIPNLERFINYGCDNSSITATVSGTTGNPTTEIITVYDTVHPRDFQYETNYPNIAITLLLIIVMFTIVDFLRRFFAKPRV